MWRGESEGGGGVGVWGGAANCVVGWASESARREMRRERERERERESRRQRQRERERERERERASERESRRQREEGRNMAIALSIRRGSLTCRERRAMPTAIAASTTRSISRLRIMQTVAPPSSPTRLWP